jgi:predicted Zn finger-like uncharacterized protein
VARNGQDYSAPGEEQPDQMKLVCDRCKATYSIADDKVRGKVVTLRCKTCGDSIQARGPGATADRIPTMMDEPASGREGRAEAVSPASSGRPPALRPSVLDRPLRADKASRAATADLTKPASAASANTPDEAPRESANKRRTLNEPALRHAPQKPGGEPAGGRAPAPPRIPAVGRFASDEAGKLKHAPPPAAGAKPPARPTARAGAEERRPAFGGGAPLGVGTEEDELDAPKTTVASFENMAAALGAATASAPDEWFLSIDGDQRGPFTRETLEEEIPKYVDQEVYVWREGFAGWKPVTEAVELEPGLRLTPPPPAGVVRGTKLPAADRADALRQSPWSAASRGDPEAESEPPWKGQSHAEPLPPPPEGSEPGGAAVPRKVAKESSGAEVVSIQAARERAASRPHRGGTPLGTAPAKPAAHGPGEAPRLPGAGVGEASGAARAADLASHDAGAVASSHGGAAMPMPVSEPEPVDDLVVSEPSQAFRLRDYAPAAGLRAGSAGVPYQDLDESGSGVHGHIDELAVAAGVVVPTSHHRMNRLLLIAAVGGALATLSLAGVVIYLVGRGPQVQVREIVRLKSPEELGADTEAATARLLAEKQFADAKPSAAGNLVVASREPPTRKGAGRPAAAGGPTPGRRAEPKVEGGSGMAGFFKSAPGTGGSSGVAAPNLASPPEVRQPVGRRVSDDEIVKTINRQRGTLSVCYNRALKHDNTLKSVRLDVTVKFGFSGRPTSVVINDPKHHTSFLGQCLTDTIRRWSFPPGGDERTTVMPLVLQGE